MVKDGVDITGVKVDEDAESPSASSVGEKATSPVADTDLGISDDEIFEDVETKERVVPLDVLKRVRQEEARKRKEILDQFEELKGMFDKPKDDGGNDEDTSPHWTERLQQVAQAAQQTTQAAPQFSPQDMKAYNDALREKFEEDPFGTFMGLFGQMYNTVRQQEKYMEQDARSLMPGFDDIPRHTVSDAELARVLQNPEAIRFLIAKEKAGVSKKPGKPAQAVKTEQPVDAAELRKQIMEELYSKIKGIDGASGMSSEAPTPHSAAGKSEPVKLDKTAQRFWGTLGVKDEDKLRKRAKRLQDLESGGRTFVLED